MDFLEYIKSDTIDKHERGFQKHKKDKGNYNSKGELVGTKYGISARFYEQYTGKTPTEKDIKDLTKDRAAEILYDEFYKKPGYDKMEEKKAKAMFDFAVHSGPSRANKYSKDAKTFKDVIEGRRKYIKSLNRPEFEKGWMKRLDNLENDLTPFENPYGQADRDIIQKIKDRIEMKKSMGFMGSGYMSDDK